MVRPLASTDTRCRASEELEFREQADAAGRAGDESRLGLDWFAFVVSFKGVFLEGAEVVFIVITFGLNADNVPLAAVGALAAAVVVALAGVIAHRPPSAVPENTLKYVVGLLLATFGTFWSVEGLGVFRDGGESLAWPGGEVALLGLRWRHTHCSAWSWSPPSSASVVRAPVLLSPAGSLLSRALVRALPRVAGPRPTAPAAQPPSPGRARDARQGLRAVLVGPPVGDDWKVAAAALSVLALGAILGRRGDRRGRDGPLRRFLITELGRPEHPTESGRDGQPADHPDRCAAACRRGNRHGIRSTGRAPRAGTRLELSQARSGTSFVRYLPKDVPAGDPHPQLTVATYARPNGFAEIQAAAKNRAPRRCELCGGGLAVYDPRVPTNMHLAYPGDPYQIEVFSPKGDLALRLVSGRAIRPVP